MVSRATSSLQVGAQLSAIAIIDDVLRLETPKPKIAPLEAAKIQPKELPIDNVSSSLKRIDPKGDAIQFVTDSATKTGGKTIGLGLDTDLALHRGTGAITYKGAGWQEAGLTKVDWGRASMDNFYFKQSFQEAAGNAGGIKFNVTRFNPAYPKPGITNFEFNHIINNPSLLQKTTFIQNGNQVFWNGTRFIR